MFTTNIKLKDRKRFIDELSEIVVSNEEQWYGFPVDIYLYTDDEGNWKLDTFSNVGGNSYIDDDHDVIWTVEASESRNFDSLQFRKNLTDEQKHDIRVKNLREYLDEELEFHVDFNFWIKLEFTD